MALTLRTAGTVVTSSFFNDYYNLLTGTMLDQPVTVGNNLALLAQTSMSGFTKVAPAAFYSSSAGGGLKHNSTYSYCYSFVTGYGTPAVGESTVGPTGNGVTAASPTPDTYVMNVTIGIGPTNTTARKIYRTVAGGSGSFYLVGTVANNTATSFSDSMTDATLVTQQVAPVSDSFGGSIMLKDKNGVTQFSASNDGYMVGTSILANTINLGYGGGTGNPTGLWIKDSAGAYHIAMCALTADNDLHIMAQPATHRIKFSKDAFAYDILTLDCSGGSGATTLNGSLTMSGQLTITTGDLYLGSSSNFKRLIFNGGNNGGIDNSSGGWMDIYTGGTSGLRVWGGVTNIIGHTGAVECFQVNKDGTILPYGPIVFPNGTTHGSLNAMQFDIVTSAIGSFTHNLGMTPIGAFVTGRDTSANNDYYTVTALSSTAITVAGKVGGHAYNVLLIG